MFWAKETLFTNAHPDNPTRLWMEYVGEWHLNYKDKKEMYSIAEGLNNIADVDFYRDEFGVYQYIEVIKDGNQFKQIN